jgi:hypothetical protein
LCLDLHRLLATGALRPGSTTSGAWAWTDHCTGERVASVGYQGLPKVREGELTLNYGGVRWYFVCPYTGRRALKLYKWSGIERFCHRTAIRPLPTYASQRVGGHDRINAQRWTLRRRLCDGCSDLFGEPIKPKRMRWRTFQKFLNRDAELDERDALYLCRLLGRLGVASGIDDAG